MTDWHDRNDWWEGTQGVIFSSAQWESAPLQIEQVLALAGFELPVSIDVLDLPCGVGRHSLELARRGCRVTAVDRTPAYLARASEKAGAEGLTIELVEADMRAFHRPAAFDLAINLFTSFGYFADPADEKRVLASFHASLRPGGVLVMEMMGKEVLARNFVPRVWRELDDGSIVLEDRTITGDWSWIENRWIVIKGTERREYPFANRVYSAVELRGLLEEAGFAPVHIHGSLAGRPYDHTAIRLVAVAHKPR